MNKDLKERSLLQVLTNSAVIHTLAQGADESLLDDSLIDDVRELKLKTVRTSSLFMMNSTRHPHCYLRFYSGEKLIAESGVQEENLRPDWSQENIEIKLEGRIRRCVGYG